MPARRTGNTRSGSTTWDYRTGKIGRAPATPASRVARLRRWGGLARWTPKDPLTVRITYRGGNSCYYLVEARGRSGVFSGNIAIHDAMREVYADPGRFTEV